MDLQPFSLKPKLVLDRHEPHLPSLIRFAVDRLHQLNKVLKQVGHANDSACYEAGTRPNNTFGGGRVMTVSEVWHPALSIIADFSPMTYLADVERCRVLVDPH